MNMVIPKYGLFILLSIILLSSGVILSTTNPAFATINAWTTQTSPIIEPNFLESVFFIDEDNGWAVGLADNSQDKRGYIQYTDNGGENWTKQTSGSGRYLFDVFFIDANTGWVSGSFGAILHTDNGGTTWTTQRDDSSYTQLGSIFFIDATNGWTTGFGGVILHTTNGGTIWESQASGRGEYLRSVSFIDANNGHIVGDGGVILHTTNGGENWTKQTSGISNNLHDITFVGNNGWIVGSGGVILHTTNGGTIWESQASGSGEYLRSVSFIDANNGLISGHGGVILHTTNGGTTWTTTQASYTQSIFTSVSLADINNGWAVLLNGDVYHGYAVPPQAPTITTSTTSVNLSPITINGESTTPGSTVTLYNGETLVTTTTADKSGDFSFTQVELVDGENIFTVTVTDNIDNTSLPSDSVTITLDTIPPDIPTIDQPFSPTNNSAVTISGTAEANSLITLTKNDTPSTILVDSDGIWSIDVTLDEGNNSFTVTATDAAGNQSDVSASVAITLDTTPPIITINQIEITLEVGIQVLDLLVGVSTDDNSDITTTGTVDVSTVGTYTITYSSTDAAGNQADQKTRTYSVTDTTPPVITINPAEITLELYSAAPVLLDGVSTDDNSDITTTGTVDVSTVGTYTITYSSTDAAGNQADQKTRTYSVIIADDITPPKKPIIHPSTTPTNDIAVTISGTAEANSSVTLTRNSELYTIQVDSDGNWSVDVTLTSGQNTFEATATDAAGNQSDKSEPIIITFDDTAPPVPTITTVSATVTSSPITIDGESTESGATITLYNGETLVTTTTANNSGDFSFTQVELTNGSNSFTVTATDSIDNTSLPSTSVVITLNSPDPDPLSPPVITTSDTTVTSSPFTISGTSINAESVGIHDGDTLVGKVSPDSSGNWSVTVTLIEGTNTFTAVVIDADNNTSTHSISVTITLNSQATPTPAPTINQPDAPTNDSTITITGSAEVNSSVTLTLNSVPHVITAGSDGNWSVDVTLTNGENTFTAVARIGVISSDSSNTIIVTFDPGTGGSGGDTTPPELPKKKSGGGSSDWKVKPTFGKSWERTTAQLVENGFIFNGVPLTITDNWHTDFAKTSSIIGDDNHVEIKVYAARSLSTATLLLGIPEIGKSSEAETGIYVKLSRNYTNPNNYDITEITHEQKEPLINENNTRVSIVPSFCASDSPDMRCHTISFDFTIMAPLKAEVVAIKASDFQRRSTTTFINEGVEFVGESLLDAKTHSMYVRNTNQNSAESLTLTQQDRRYNVYEDSNGYLWTVSDYGSWTQITKPDFERHVDSPNSVMTRVHSGFASLIIDEQDKAVLIFDGTKLVSVIPESFSYDFSAINRDLLKSDVLSGELHIEQLKAQLIVNEMSELRSLVDD